MIGGVPGGRASNLVEQEPGFSATCCKAQGSLDIWSQHGLLVTSLRVPAAGLMGPGSGPGGGRSSAG